MQPLQACLADHLLARELIERGTDEERVTAGRLPACLPQHLVDIAAEPPSAIAVTAFGDSGRGVSSARGIVLSRPPLVNRALSRTLG